MALEALSLFSGIGGMDRGFEQEGIKITAQVEIDPLYSAVLARHWPDVFRHNNVKTFESWWRSVGQPQYDLILGGFPCQPFSIAGSRRGIHDERWLWPEFYKIIQLVQPKYVAIENVAALRTDAGGHTFRGLLRNLADSGYDAEWSVLSAKSLGFPYKRDRLFVVACPNGLLGKSWDFKPQESWNRFIPVSDVDEATDQALASFHFDGREADGASGGMAVAGGCTARMVEAGGNAVVPAMARVVASLVNYLESVRGEG